MKEYSVCLDAIRECLEHKRFTVASLYKEQKTLDMHIHDCYELYYAISGGNQFFIADQWYEICRGDLFAINHNETHHVFEKTGIPHERYVISIHPEFLSSISTGETDLSKCFQRENKSFCHKISLDKEDQKQFLYLLHKISAAEGYGADVIENTAFSELMVLTNRLFLRPKDELSESPLHSYHPLVSEMIQYINENITAPLTVSKIAEHFFLSESYVCRIFKQCTGTTVNKYLTGRRIGIAKTLLAGGSSVLSACELSGFNDYSNFIKTFTKSVGISPKRYSKFSNS